MNLVLQSAQVVTEVHLAVIRRRTRAGLATAWAWVGDSSVGAATSRRPHVGAPGIPNG